MHILAAGDSFTALGASSKPILKEPQEHVKAAWPNYIVDKHKVSMCAEMAAGNELISRNVVDHIYRFPPDAVIIGWSDPNRFETFIDSKDDPTMYDWCCENLPKTGQSFTNYIENGFPFPGKEVSWLKSGGGYGLWKYGQDQLDWKTRVFLKNFHNEELQYLKTIESILRVQWLCETKEIPLFNFKAWDHSLFNITYETSKLLESQINPFTWYSSTLLDFCKEKGFETPRPEHPPKKYQKLFAKEVIIPWIDKL